MNPDYYLEADFSDRELLDGGNFYKGNLHSHTTLSDGKLTPDELISEYKSHGYSFLAITDHYKYFNDKSYNTDDFLIIPGVEVNFDDKEHYSFDHIVGVKLDGECALDSGYYFSTHKPLLGTGVQHTIDRLNDTGHYVIYAHCHWSHKDASTMGHLHGLNGFEVYNSCCDRSFASGYSDQHYDQLLMRGQRLAAFAVDDTHKKDALFGGWISVNAEELSYRSISKAICENRFYASTGAEIYSYGVKDKTVYITCSPASKIYFKTYGHWGRLYKGSNLTCAEYTLRGDEQFVMAEIQNSNGETAWTQPIYFI